MTLLNESEWDRGARLLSGLVLLSAGWALSFNIVGIVLLAIGGIALATGIVGWCPAYTVFGRSTVKTPPGHCPNCHAEHREG